MMLDRESEILQQFHCYLQQRYPEGFLFPPATEEQIRITEDLMEISLPPLLKALYLQIANGGFSPERSLKIPISGVLGGFQHESRETLLKEKNSFLEGTSIFVDIEVLEERAGPPYIVNLSPYMFPKYMFCLDENSYYAYFIHCKTSRIYLATTDCNGLIEYSGEIMEGLTWFRIKDSLADWLLSWMQGESWGDWSDEACENLLGKNSVSGYEWEDEPLYISSTHFLE